MNAQAASTDFGADLSSFIRRIDTFASFVKRGQFGPDAIGLHPVKRRGMLPAAVAVAVEAAEDGIDNAVPCPGSIQRLCTPTSPPLPRIRTPRRISPIPQARESEVSSETTSRVLVTDGERFYEVTVLTPEIVRCSEWELDGDRIGTWAALFGPKGRYVEASPGQQLDRLRSYLSSLPKRKTQAAIIAVQKASVARSLPKVEPITIHVLVLCCRLKNVWTNVHLRLRPVQRSIDSQEGSDMWTFVDSLTDSFSDTEQVFYSTNHVLGE